MQAERLEKLRSIAREVSQDMAADAKNFDGKPFNGRTVAEYFGNQGAAIAALANIISEILKEQPHAD